MSFVSFDVVGGKIDPKPKLWDANPFFGFSRAKIATLGRANHSNKFIMEGFGNVKNSFGTNVKNNFLTYMRPHYFRLHV